METRHAARLAHGLCRYCGTAPHRPGKQTCVACGQERARIARQQRAAAPPPYRSTGQARSRTGEDTTGDPADAALVQQVRDARAAGRLAALRPGEQAVLDVLLGNYGRTQALPTAARRLLVQWLEGAGTRPRRQGG
jgi:ribosomal protein L37E